MLFVGTSIIHPSTEGVFLLCNILDLLIYRLYDITIKNNTDTGNVKIRIFTPDTIDECELERMKVMQLNEVQKLVRSSYKGTVTSLL